MQHATGWTFRDWEIRARPTIHAVRRTVTAEGFGREALVGGLAGSIGIFFAHPLDTLKVRQQTDALHTPNVWRCLAATVHSAQENGWRTLFRGVTAPVIGNLPSNAMCFLAHSTALRIAGHADPTSSSVPLLDHLRAGVIAGCFTAPILCLAELPKCQKQVFIGLQQGLPSTFEIFRRLYKLEGLRGPFRGMTVTYARDVPQFALYFGCFHALKRSLEQLLHMPDLIAEFTAGGLTGAIIWGSTYPLELVKTCIQSAPPGCPREQRQIVPVAINLCKKNGLKALFTLGLGTCVVRGILCNAVTFSAYYQLMRWWTAPQAIGPSKEATSM